MVMQYVPFQPDEDPDANAVVAQASSPKSCQGGVDINQKTRKQQQKSILEFIDKIFGEHKYLTLEEYIRINQDVSSEMFVSLMRVLHSCIPCTNNFFKLYEKNSQNQAGK